MGEPPCWASHASSEGAWRADGVRHCPLKSGFIPSPRKRPHGVSSVSVSQLSGFSLYPSGFLSFSLLIWSSGRRRLVLLILWGVLRAAYDEPLLRQRRENYRPSSCGVDRGLGGEGGVIVLCSVYFQLTRQDVYF